MQVNIARQYYPGDIIRRVCHDPDDYVTVIEINHFLVVEKIGNAGELYDVIHIESGFLKKIFLTDTYTLIHEKIA